MDSSGKFEVCSRLQILVLNKASTQVEGNFFFLILLFDISSQVEEIYNFNQDDLLTEDILILDTHAEVFVCVGQTVDPKEKQSAFEIGQVLA